MVLAGRRAATPAIVVPDEQSWTVWGMDPLREDLRPVLDVGGAGAVLLPERVPDALAERLDGILSAVPPGTRTVVRAAPGLDGPATGTWPGEQERDARGSASRPDVHDAGDDAGGGAAEDGAHDGDDTDDKGHGSHEDHAGHDDMMAITGDPSADGLVMERIGLSVGPLASPLPGGLVAELALDGDVVAECRVRATLRRPRSDLRSPALPPDALAPVTWAAAMAVASEAESGVATRPGAWLRLAGVELERALSHLAWLRALARVLGWPTLVEATSAVLGPLIASRGRLPVELGSPDLPDSRAEDATALLDIAAGRAVRLRELCQSRRLAGRTARLGALSREAVVAGGLFGPVARASGVARDARTQDPAYGELGFAPAARPEGDALARTLLRLDELDAAIALVRGALERAGRHADPPPQLAPPAAVTLEGPRGPVRAQRMGGEWRLTAPGEHVALTAAGEAAVGLEWAAALVVLVSFDLSPWKVGP